MVHSKNSAVMTANYSLEWLKKPGQDHCGAILFPCVVGEDFVHVGLVIHQTLPIGMGKSGAYVDDLGARISSRISRNICAGGVDCGISWCPGDITVAGILTVDDIADGIASSSPSHR